MLTDVDADCDGEGVGLKDWDTDALTEPVAHCDVTSERVSATLRVAVTDALRVSDTDGVGESDVRSVELADVRSVRVKDGLEENESVGVEDDVVDAHCDVVRDGVSDEDGSVLGDPHAELETEVDVHTVSVLENEGVADTVGDRLGEIVDVFDTERVMQPLNDSDAEPVKKGVPVALRETLSDPVGERVPLELIVPLGERLRVMSGEDEGETVTVTVPLRNALGDPDSVIVMLLHDEILTDPVDETQGDRVGEADKEKVALPELCSEPALEIDAVGHCVALKVTDCEVVALTLCDALRERVKVFVALDEGVADGERDPENVADALRVTDGEPVVLRDTEELGDTDAVREGVGDVLGDVVTVSVGLTLGDMPKDGFSVALLTPDAVTEVVSVLLELGEAVAQAERDHVTLAEDPGDVDTEYDSVSVAETTADAVPPTGVEDAHWDVLRDRVGEALALGERDAEGDRDDEMLAEGLREGDTEPLRLLEDAPLLVRVSVGDSDGDTLSVFVALKLGLPLCDALRVCVSDTVLQFVAAAEADVELLLVRIAEGDNDSDIVALHEGGSDTEAVVEIVKLSDKTDDPVPVRVTLAQGEALADGVSEAVALVEDDTLDERDAERLGQELRVFEGQLLALPDIAELGCAGSDTTADGDMPEEPVVVIEELSLAEPLRDDVEEPVTLGESDEVGELVDVELALALREADGELLEVRDAVGLFDVELVSNDDGVTLCVDEAVDVELAHCDTLRV